jgi:glycosyltransferase involved in cell wall biosynthesis
MTAARITAILCTYNRYEMASGAIESLLQQEGGPFRVMVVDNSPDEERAAAFAAKYAGRAVTFRRQLQAGLARARNSGLDACDTEFVAFIDDDAVAAGKWLGEIVAAFDSASGDVAIAGGRVVPRWDAPRPGWLPDSALAYLSLVDLGEQPRELVGREWLAGTNIAFRTEGLREAGGFAVQLGRAGDGQSLMSNEETEAMRRIVGMGHRAFYQPGAIVEHRIGAERLTREWFRRRVAWQCVSDFVVDPEFAMRRASGAQRAASRRALIGKGTAAEQFRRELKGVYADTAGLLAGGTPSGKRTGWVASALRLARER